MDPTAILNELAAAFGGARDVTPAPGQPLYVELTALRIPPPWTPETTRALLCFSGWPDRRPDFWIAPEVVNAAQQPPDSSNEAYVLGARWRAFSYQFAWNSDARTPTRAVQLWLTRLHLPR
jgi:hypothetical protein